MAVYYITCILAMVFAWLSMHMKTYVREKKLVFAVVFSSLPLFLLSSLRYGVGTDFYNYVNIFHLAEFGVFKKSEFLFNFVNVAISKVGLSEQWLFVVCAAIFCFFTYFAIFEQSPNPVLSVFLLVGMNFFFAFLNVMREMVGASILLYGIRFIIANDFKKYLLCVIAAWGFHFSCILFLPFYWIRNFKMTRTRALILTVCVIIGGSLVEKVIFMALPVFNLEHYIGSRFDKGVVGYVYIAVQLVIDVLLLWKYSDDVKYNILFIIQMVNTWIAFFSGRVVLIGRLRHLFGFSCIILIPLALSRIKNAELRFLLSLMVFICFAVYIYFVANAGHTGVLPYNTIFDF